MVPWNLQEPESCQLQRASTHTPTRSSALRPRWELSPRPAQRSPWAPPLMKISGFAPATLCITLFVLRRDYSLTQCDVTVRYPIAQIEYSLVVSRDSLEQRWTLGVTDYTDTGCMLTKRADRIWQLRDELYKTASASVRPATSCMDVHWMSVSTQSTPLCCHVTLMSVLNKKSYLAYLYCRYISRLNSF